MMVPSQYKSLFIFCLYFTKTGLCHKYVMDGCVFRAFDSWLIWNVLCVCNFKSTSSAVVRDCEFGDHESEIALGRSRQVAGTFHTWSLGRTGFFALPVLPAGVTVGFQGWDPRYRRHELSIVEGPVLRGHAQSAGGMVVQKATRCASGRQMS